MLLRQEAKRTRRAAFTLMEMLVVVAIIVALAGIGGYFLLGQLGQSQRDVARVRAKGTLTKAVETYKIRHNRWPDSLDQLLSGDEKGPPILEDRDAIKDPWGGAFQYDRSGPMNRGIRPDIWATDPSDTNVRLGNWPDSQ